MVEDGSGCTQGNIQVQARAKERCSAKLSMHGHRASQLLGLAISRSFIFPYHSGIQGTQCMNHYGI